MRAIAATAIAIMMSVMIVIRVFMSSPSIEIIVKSERIIRAHLLRRKQSAKTIIGNRIILRAEEWQGFPGLIYLTVS